jgi:predicted transcriptional regulator
MPQKTQLGIRDNTLMRSWSEFLHKHLIIRSGLFSLGHLSDHTCGKCESQISTYLSQGFYSNSPNLTTEFGMTHTKLRDYLSILEVLVCRPLEFEVVLLEIGQELSLLNRYLDFLTSHGLVEKLHLGKKRFVYAITEKGINLLNALEDQEYLDEHHHLMMLH